MAKRDVTIGELRNMQMKDLEREIRAQRTTVARLRLMVQLGKEKDSSKLFVAKKQLSRMLTILREKELQQQAEVTTVSAPQAA